MCVYVCVCVCMCVYMCVCVCMCMYVCKPMGHSFQKWNLIPSKRELGTYSAVKYRKIRKLV